MKDERPQTPRDRAFLDTDQVAIGIGSNLGDRLTHIQCACAKLATRVTDIVASRLYATEPVGYTEQEEFLNAVVVGRWHDGPHQLLDFLQDIERSGGRIRGQGPRFGPRTIDLDILLIGRQTLDTPDLTVPHPRMYERRFVLDPLLELYPELLDPASRTAFSVFARRLPQAGIYEYGEPPI
ncbi:MAG: 2-amino-4-hydroxy-6-hydroxymethyldihydropteridine diphosphokinase [Spirochaetaceae bacterium]